jgi:hypothetical protein
MSGASKMEMIILFPSELRRLGKAIGAYRAKAERGEKPMGEELANIFKLAEIALYHLRDDSADGKFLILAAEPVKRKEKV